MKFNILFPMAGEASRFGYVFKPFKKISDLTFIELAFVYFKKYINFIDTVYFVVTKEQFIKNKVKFNLNNFFSNINFEIIILQKKTNSQKETICNAISLKNLKGNFFICDCDHSIDISPMITFLKNNDPDILVPFYPIEKDDKNFDKIKINIKNNFYFHNKNTISNKGIIGCHYIKNIEKIVNNNNFDSLLDFFQKNIKILNIKIIQIENANFFGTQEILNELIKKKKEQITVFCDLDGTIINHEANGTYDNKELLLDGVKNKLNLLKKKGKIVITTARNKKDMIEKILKRLKIPYDEIIVGLNSGPRLLINDIKPSMPFNIMAKSYNIIRNTGMNFLNFDNLINHDKIVQKFKGGSFSKTLLVNTNNNYVVRKIIYKNRENMIHYEKLKLQKFNINRFNCYLENLCPKILNEEDNDYYYYFDIEYLEKYSIFHNLPNKLKYFDKLFIILSENIYDMKKINKNKYWLDNFIKNKINIKKYENLSPNIKKILNMENITINGINCNGFKKIFSRSYQEFNPEFLAPIHGDLTLENIMINTENEDIKLIDIDGCNFIDAIELDIGKIFQSTVSKYEIWSCDNPIININYENNIINTKEYTKINEHSDNLKYYSKWLNILNKNNLKDLNKVGIFYMILHLCRMIPYRFNSSENQAIYAIKEVIYWYHYLIHTL